MDDQLVLKNRLDFICNFMVWFIGSNVGFWSMVRGVLVSGYCDGDVCGGV